MFCELQEVPGLAGVEICETGHGFKAVHYNLL
jgi:hypothetical protein